MTSSSIPAITLNDRAAFDELNLNSAVSSTSLQIALNTAALGGGSSEAVGAFAKAIASAEGRLVAEEQVGNDGRIALSEVALISDAFFENQDFRGSYLDSLVEEFQERGINVSRPDADRAVRGLLEQVGTELGSQTGTEQILSGGTLSIDEADSVRNRFLTNTAFRGAYLDAVMEASQETDTPLTRAEGDELIRSLFVRSDAIDDGAREGGRLVQDGRVTAEEVSGIADQFLGDRDFRGAYLDAAAEELVGDDPSLTTAQARSDVDARVREFIEES